MKNNESPIKLGLIENENTKIEKVLKTRLDNKEEVLALDILKKVDSQIPSFDINLWTDRENNKFYFILKNKENVNIPLSIPLSIGSLESMWESLVKLLNHDWAIQLIWWREWRAIAEVQMFWSEANADRIVNTSQKSWLSDEANIDENNKTEELFKFIQTVNNIPEEEWKISDSIKNSGPIWI